MSNVDRTELGATQASCTSPPGPFASESVDVVGAPPSAPEMRGQAAERPETMHIGNNG